MGPRTCITMSLKRKPSGFSLDDMYEPDDEPDDEPVASEVQKTSGAPPQVPPPDNTSATLIPDQAALCCGWAIAIAWPLSGKEVTSTQTQINRVSFITLNLQIKLEECASLTKYK